MTDNMNIDSPVPVNHAPTLKLARLGIDTYRENVVYLHRDCEIYRAEGFQALSKVQICGNGQRILAVLNVVDDDRIVSFSHDRFPSRKSYTRR